LSSIGGQKARTGERVLLCTAIGQIRAVARGFSRKAPGNWGGGAAPPYRDLVAATPRCALCAISIFLAKKCFAKRGLQKGKKGFVNPPGTWH